MWCMVCVVRVVRDIIKSTYINPPILRPVTVVLGEVIRTSFGQAKEWEGEAMAYTKALRVLTALSMM